MRTTTGKQLRQPRAIGIHHIETFFSIEADSAPVGGIERAVIVGSVGQRARRAAVGVGRPDRTRIAISIGVSDPAIGAGERGVASFAHRDRQHREPRQRRTRYYRKPDTPLTHRTRHTSHCPSFHANRPVTASASTVTGLSSSPRTESLYHFYLYECSFPVTVGDYLVGLLLLGAIAAGFWTSGRFLRLWLLPGWQGAPATLAAVVLALSVAVVTCEALGLVGLLNTPADRDRGDLSCPGLAPKLQDRKIGHPETSGRSQADRLVFTLATGDGPY